jgi:predicted nucleotidyltransferase
MPQSLNNYLKNLSSFYYIESGSVEDKKIETSINAVEKSLKSYFGNKISEVFTFGSYTRDTILPRKYDINSDVDVMIVFDSQVCGVQAETYRKWLKDFADKKYPNSIVAKDFPTIVIDMLHIKLDLVPTIVKNSFWSGETLQIPDSGNNWQETDPNDFYEDLKKANKKYNFIVKPIIRLLKAWNCQNGYPYSSFELEKIIADMNFSGDNYESGFYYAINNLPTSDLGINANQKVTTLKNAKNWIADYLDKGDIVKAKEWLHRILPNP